MIKITHAPILKDEERWLLDQEKDGWVLIAVIYKAIINETIYYFRNAD